MTTNAELARWVDEVAKLTEPDQIHWCDGSDSEKDALTRLMLDTGEARARESLDTAEARLSAAGGRVFRLSPADVGAGPMTPAGAAALLLYLSYPLAHAVADALGFDPDRPATLSKVTQTT